MSAVITGETVTDTGRIAVVTGAAGGLGAFVARRLHAQGHRVVLADIAIEDATAVAAELSADGSTAMALELDVSHKANFESALAEIEKVWGTPSIVVNNAARTQTADVLTVGEEEFTEVLNTNVNSIFFGCQVFGSAMADNGFGRIVNLASLAGQNGGTATGAHYAASKGAILTATKVFARELAGRGVTVNAIAPGPLDLPVFRKTIPADKVDAMIGGIPVGRLGDPAFVADMVALLTAENAYFATGACWDVNGGLYVR
ncbi:SDR family NAD(P)-dependent oxidoreductase [Gordonia desulfuricans]|uniref:SDR family NAD(P)-dependent oxidoreductase n=1 Tax=Gordonia desulfuricans TaxID=89051 RepID=UPI000A45794E|nr:SDR family oxidoreductase [Gordonia desulfuricans]